TINIVPIIVNLTFPNVSIGELWQPTIESENVSGKTIYGSIQFEDPLDGTLHNVGFYNNGTSYFSIGNDTLYTSGIYSGEYSIKKETSEGYNSYVYLAEGVPFSFTVNRGYMSFENFLAEQSSSMTITIDDQYGLAIHNYNPTSMYRMFYNSQQLSIDNEIMLDMASWDTSQCTDISYAFYYCTSLGNIRDVSNWDTSNVTDMAYAFYRNTNFDSDMSNWDTSKVGLNEKSTSDMATIDMANMFNRCTALGRGNNGYRDFTGWDVSHVRSMQGMFYECTGLTCLDLSTWDTSSCSNFRSMFRNCSNLAILDLSNFDTRNAGSPFMATMFTSAGLQYLIIGSSTFKFYMTDSSIGGLNSTCKILVPRDLLNTFNTATNWSTRGSGSTLTDFEISRGIAGQFEALENYTITRSNGSVTVTPNNS
ncbi:MAG: BspA family leucine-rich repeat surface protein, partial [Acholeplasmatales bacterium]|nr:BspA family leucine-rich repeat surface protein [Acholeplasmatales bacterium]